MTAPDIAQALAHLLEDLEDEKKMHAAMLDRLGGMARLAVRLFNAGDLTGCHLTCKAAFDLSRDALNDSEPVEPLCGLLGYSEPDPSEVMS